jgi:hypothetical protein
MKKTEIGNDCLQKDIDEAIAEYQTICAGLKHFTASEPLVKMVPGVGYHISLSLSVTGFAKEADTPYNRLMLLSHW